MNRSCCIIQSPHPPSSIFILHTFQPAVRLCEQMQADPRTPWVSRKRDSWQMDDRRSVEEGWQPLSGCYQKHSFLLQKVPRKPSQARSYRLILYITWTTAIGVHELFNIFSFHFVLPFGAGHGNIMIKWVNSMWFSKTRPCTRRLILHVTKRKLS